MANEPAPAPPSGSSAPTPRQVAAVLLAVLAVVFVLQNTERVALTLIVIDVVLPLWVATVSLLVIGIAIGWLLSARRAKNLGR